MMDPIEKKNYPIFPFFFGAWGWIEKGQRVIISIHAHFLLKTGLSASYMNTTVKHSCANFPHTPKDNRTWISQLDFGWELYSSLDWNNIFFLRFFASWCLTTNSYDNRRKSDIWTSLSRFVYVMILSWSGYCLSQGGSVHLHLCAFHVLVCIWSFCFGALLWHVYNVLFPHCPILGKWGIVILLISADIYFVCFPGWNQYSQFTAECGEESPNWSESEAAYTVSTIFLKTYLLSSPGFYVICGFIDSYSWFKFLFMRLFGCLPMCTTFGSFLTQVSTVR